MDAVVQLVSADGPAVESAEQVLRFRSRVRCLALGDAEWLGRFLPWLRMCAPPGSSTSPVPALALEAAQVLLASGRPASVRSLVGSVLQRADEPGLAVSYWQAQFGAALPEPVRLGVGDAVARLYDERGYLAYGSVGLPFASVLASVEAVPRTPAQEDLFDYLGSGGSIPQSLAVLKAHAWLAAIPDEERADLLADWGSSASTILTGAGMTWTAVAAWLEAPMDAAAWEAVVPMMEYGDLLAQLPAFDAAGLPPSVAALVASRLADPLEVTLADRPLAAVLRAAVASPSERWHWALSEALRLCVGHSAEPELISVIERAHHGDWPF